MALFPQPYLVIVVDPATIEALETMGTRRKHWFRDPHLRRALFKAARPGSGEDWAEKIASELAAKIGLPHAHYELGRSGPDHGSVSPTFVPERSALIHGNELLVALDPTYVEFDPQQRRAGYTVDRVFEALGAAGTRLPPEYQLSLDLSTAGDLFAGYLLLDALIGNTDRHHENWGVIEDRSTRVPVRYLAPTFDHASSLGRNEPEQRVSLRVSTSDTNATVEAYASRAKCPFFGPSGNALSPFQAFAEAAQIHSRAATVWKDQLVSLNEAKITEIIQRVPGDRITPTRRVFLVRFLLHNRQRLLEL